MKYKYLFTGIFLGLAVISHSIVAQDSIPGKPFQHNETTEAPIQVTFFYPLGSHGLTSKNYTYRFSLNMLSGIVGGLNGIEMGSFTNVVTGNAKGAQFAGIGNYVHQEMNGAQFSGLFNVSRGFVKGGQFTGLVNLSTKSAEGVQLSGLLNINRGNFRGLQGAGLADLVTGDVEGVQMAGLFNYAGGEVTSGQFAGLANVSLKNSKGAQLSGLINYSPAHKGLQASGLVNVAAKETTGSQISGVVNYTRKLSGVQIGLINIADTVKRGTMIGLVSYTRNGYKSISISSDESFHGHISLKMGLQNFYTLYNFGFASLEKDVWAYGLGFGTHIIDNHRFALALEGVSYHIKESDDWYDELNMLVRLNLNFQYKITEKFAVHAGLSANTSISQVKDEEGLLSGSKLNPKWTFYEHTGEKTKTTVFPGWRTGFTFTL